MLRGIHKASSTWLGKAVMAAVMGVIAVSFAIWGIGDIFRGFGRSAVATIGGTEISIEEFRRFYNDRLQQLGRQVGRPITPDISGTYFAVLDVVRWQRSAVPKYRSRNFADSITTACNNWGVRSGGRLHPTYRGHISRFWT